MAMTMARRGRSTKIADSIASTLVERALNRGRAHRRARTNGLEALDDDQLAARKSLLDDGVGAGLAADLDAFDRRLPVLDHEDVDALLIGDQRRLGHHDLFRGGARFDGDTHQLPVDERAGRVGKGGADEHRIGGAIDAHVDEIDPTCLVVKRVVGEPQPHIDPGDVDLVAAFARAQEIALAHGKADVHRVLADDRRQNPALRTYDVALGHVGLADLAGDRRVDFGVAEVDLRRGEIRLVGHDRALGLLVGCLRLVPRHRGPGALRQQILCPLQLHFGQDLRRFAALERALRLLDRRLEQALLDAVERLPLLDDIAFLEQHVLEETGYPRPDLDAIDRFDPADEIEAFGDRLALDLYH